MFEIVSKSKVALLMGLMVLLAGLGWTAAPKAEKSIVLKAMEEELNRSMAELKKKANPSPYFLSYLVRDEKSTRISASYGALISSAENHTRYLDASVRVGDYRLDNTHKIRGRMGSFDPSDMFRMPVPMALDDDTAAIKAALWLETDKRYKQAAEKLIQVQTNKAVKVEEEDQSDDFSQEKPEVYLAPKVDLQVDKSLWEKKVKEFSAIFKSHPKIHSALVMLTAEVANKYFVSSEGAVLQTGQNHIRLMITAQTKADDGMELARYESFDVTAFANLPDDKIVHTKIKEMIDDLLRLRQAPLVEPFTGPAILEGRASGVFFHEIFGHRIEGHRQRDEDMAQTFTKKVNERVLPEFISVYDDPSLTRLGAIELNGYYKYDDEGVKAQRVPVVENGILKNFLNSRTPIKNFNRSNGHGRGQAGRNPVSRQGNLIVQASKTVPYAKLREMLVEECKRQGKPYGLVFKDISGGFTFTGRTAPQAFKVIPLVVYRVYTDGRADELVRGVDIIGTPLAAFAKISAAADDMAVFNGYCGAESGFVPVAAASPSILVSEIEIQKKEKSHERPPVLPSPVEERP